MKVLHVIPSVDHRDGGPSAALRNMAESVALLGHEVTIATTDFPGSVNPPDAEWRGGVICRCFPRSLPGRWKYSRSLAKWLEGHLDEHDVVHVHALFSWATIPACRFAREQGVPYVLRPLGTLDPWSLRHHAWRKRPYLALIESRHLRDAAAIHVTSEMEGGHVLAMRPDARVRCLPLPVAAVRPIRRAERDSATLRILCVARLDPVKGIPLLLDVVSRLRRRSDLDVRLVVAGGGPARYSRRLARLAEERGIAGAVRFAGHVDGAEKAELLADSDVFVLLSQHENFGIAAAEAMAAGLPLVVSDQVGLADDVVRSEAGRVVALDAEAATAAVLEIAKDPELQRRMGANGARLVAEEYSPRGVGERLVALYQEVAGVARSATPA